MGGIFGGFIPPPDDGEPGRGERENPRDWLGKPYQEPKPNPPGSRYVCVRCHEELQLTYIKHVSRVSTDDGVYVRIVHACPCVKHIRAARYEWSDAALRRLFGGKDFQLPWPTVLSEEAGGEAQEAPPSLGLTPKEAAIARWLWELEYCSDAHDFLLFCRGPHCD